MKIDWNTYKEKDKMAKKSRRRAIQLPRHAAVDIAAERAANNSW